MRTGGTHVVTDRTRDTPVAGSQLTDDGRALRGAASTVAGSGSR
jgi:hypothetical protein